MPISILELSRKPEGTTETRALHFDTLEDVELAEPVAASIDITVVNPQLFAAHITASACVQRTCDYCLDDYTYSMDVDFFSEFSDEVGGEAGEDDWPIVRNMIDIEPALREEILLRLPLRSICRPDCKGISRVDTNSK